MRNVTRSRTNRMFGGVIGGIAEAAGINVWLLRIGFIILMSATAFFPLAALYVFLMFILPTEAGYGK